MFALASSRISGTATTPPLSHSPQTVSCPQAPSLDASYRRISTYFKDSQLKHARIVLGGGTPLALKARPRTLHRFTGPHDWAPTFVLSVSSGHDGGMAHRILFRDMRQPGPRALSFRQVDALLQPDLRDICATDGAERRSRTPSAAPRYVRAHFLALPRPVSPPRFGIL